MRVVVLFAERRVSIDGLSVVLGDDFPPEQSNGMGAASMASVTWDGEQVIGTAHPGDVFRDPAVVRPYINGWLKVVRDLLTGVEKGKVAEEALYQAHLDKLKQHEEELKKIAQFHDDEREKFLAELREKRAKEAAEGDAGTSAEPAKVAAK